MKVKMRYEGKTFESCNYGEYVVLEYENSKHIKIKFKNTQSIRVVTAADIRGGRVLDYEMPTLFGVGILGDVEGLERLCVKTNKVYSLWTNMLKRCYYKPTKNIYPTYEDCLVSDEFLKYKTFRLWCYNQTGFGEDYFELDKDILSITDQKTYSPENCCFIPKEINVCIRTFFKSSEKVGVTYHKRDKVYQANCSIGGKNKHLGSFKSEHEAFNVYKQAKETYVKHLANKWKDRIDPRVFDALMCWEVALHD